MNSVIFICTANICRSPMATGLFRKIVGDTPEWRVESAGTWSIENQPAAIFSQEVLASRGIDISDHRSRSVSRELLAQFDLILTMEAGHKEALKIEFPEIAHRVYMLSEMVGAKYDITDPMGSSIDEFELTAVELEQIFERGLPKIKQLAGN